MTAGRHIKRMPILWKLWNSPYENNSFLRLFSCSIYRRAVEYWLTFPWKYLPHSITRMTVPAHCSPLNPVWESLRQRHHDRHLISSPCSFRNRTRDVSSRHSTLDTRPELSTLQEHPFPLTESWHAPDSRNQKARSQVNFAYWCFQFRLECRLSAVGREEVAMFKATVEVNAL